jgi:hypothetical protein
MQGNWKDKLEQWAPEPPAGVWERLSETLAETPQPHFAQKLFQYSEEPPANTWESISAQLDAPVATPVIPLFTKNKWLRYGSAVASVLIAFFLYRQVGMSDDGYGNTAKKTEQQNIHSAPGAASVLQKDKKTNPARAAQQPTEATTAFAYSLKTPALHVNDGPLPTIQAKRAGSVRTYEVMAAAAPTLNDGYVERYIVIPVTDEVAVRLPKRLYDLFRCGEVPSYTDCAELMNRIRQQSAAPSVITTTDFAGLLELVQQPELHQ